jgi:hypothetical protein
MNGRALERAHPRGHEAPDATRPNTPAVHDRASPALVSHPMQRTRRPAPAGRTAPIHSLNRVRSGTGPRQQSLSRARSPAEMRHRRSPLPKPPYAATRSARAATPTDTSPNSAAQQRTTPPQHRIPSSPPSPTGLRFSPGVGVRACPPRNSAPQFGLHEGSPSTADHRYEECRAVNVYVHAVRCHSLGRADLTQGSTALGVHQIPPAHEPRTRGNSARLCTSRPLAKGCVRCCSQLP